MSTTTTGFSTLDMLLRFSTACPWTRVVQMLFYWIIPIVPETKSTTRIMFATKNIRQLSMVLRYMMSPPSSGTSSTPHFHYGVSAPLLVCHWCLTLKGYWSSAGCFSSHWVWTRLPALGSVDAFWFHWGRSKDEKVDSNFALVDQYYHVQGCPPPVKKIKRNNMEILVLVQKNHGSDYGGAGDVHAALYSLRTKKVGKNATFKSAASSLR